jgi:hypothetical protein
VVASRLTPGVTVKGGEEASGLASMVADLLRQNLADSRTRAAVALATRGDVGLTASDHGLSVTVSFRGGSVTVADDPGEASRQAVPAPVMAGNWLELAHVCAGQRSPFSAWRAGDVFIEPGGHPARLAAAGYLLAAPAIGEDLVRRRRRVVLAASVAAAASAGAWGVRSRRRSWRSSTQRAGNMFTMLA